MDWFLLFLSSAILTFNISTFVRVLLGFFFKFVAFGLVGENRLCKLDLDTFATGKTLFDI